MPGIFYNEGAGLFYLETDMGKKMSAGGQIDSYIRGAFNKAKVGEAEEAIALWEKAIALGWEPHPKTEKGLIIAIKKGLRDRGI